MRIPKPPSWVPTTGKRLWTAQFKLRTLQNHISRMNSGPSLSGRGLMQPRAAGSQLPRLAGGSQGPRGPGQRRLGAGGGAGGRAAAGGSGLGALPSAPSQRPERLDLDNRAADSDSQADLENLSD